MNHFEVRGAGEPCVLLHGGFGSIEMFGTRVDELAKQRRLIAIDMQGHGRTLLGDRPMSFEAMADDVVEVLDHLAVGKADVVGYSLGGLVAMAFATRHVGRLRKLVVVSAPVKRDGWLSEHTSGMDRMNASLADEMKQTPMYEIYKRVAPVVGDWPRLVDAMGALMRTQFDFSATVWPTTLLVIGDADGMKLASMVEFFALLGGGLRDAGWDGKGRPASQMAMLPDHTHYNMFETPEIVATIERFLG